MPLNSTLSGPIDLNTNPGGTSTDPADLTLAKLLMENEAGNALFCFILNETCGPSDGTEVPITAITSLNLSFALNGCPEAGFIELLAFSPTFMLDIPVTLNISDGTFLAASAGLGEVSGTGSFSCTGMVADTDGDGIDDSTDNCTLVPNTSQLDADGDGYGNFCDADLDNNLIVNFLDLGLFSNVIFTADAVADFNGDGVANFLDLPVIVNSIFQPPGPSALAP